MFLQGRHVSSEQRKLFYGAASITAEQDAAGTDRAMLVAQSTVAGDATRTNNDTAVDMPMDSKFIWTGNNERKEAKQEECANEHWSEDPRHLVGWTGGNQTKLTSDSIERRTESDRASFALLSGVPSLLSSSPSFPRISFP